ncbi:MAG: GIY-YIG nuclease family protein [Chloroflexi bacterium]|nr:GIY-YIG nuclease family protein [Chloroflexota bacterium]
MKKAGGAYVLVLVLDRPTSIAVGKLGEFSFPAGYYAYVGSALGGLDGRLRRYVGPIVRRHWHIDYLRPRARLVDIWYAFSRERRECAWARALAALSGTRVVAPGFGSSDCRCRSHLFHSHDLPSFGVFRKALPGEAVFSAAVNGWHRING